MLAVALLAGRRVGRPRFRAFAVDSGVEIRVRLLMAGAQLTSASFSGWGNSLTAASRWQPMHGWSLWTDADQGFRIDQ